MPCPHVTLSSSLLSGSHFGIRCIAGTSPRHICHGLVNPNISEKWTRCGGKVCMDCIISLQVWVLSFCLTIACLSSTSEGLQWTCMLFVHQWLSREIGNVKLIPTLFINQNYDYWSLNWWSKQIQLGQVPHSNKASKTKPTSLSKEM